jgi:predicted DNA-binding protein with PD1-like motif
MSGLLAFATDYQLTGSHFTGIGGFRDVVLGYYDWDAKAIRRNPIREQVEVASLIGTIALGMDGKPVVHGHVVLGKSDGSALAGHLFEGHVRPTLEIVVEEVPEHLQRHRDERTGMLMLSL